ncbi:phosphatidylserine decarboxylase proenzyme 2-like isoform X3 [Zingiber officinale]|uniref:phosphatidylserine decarboxylase proenzyme 2-like isoform X3 n=1 Tax=Zingiber officinale TaxID=94328 RepID=UPI001C4B6508|nr:phosphatidylserine decarboxylase proenzyme 2-like isoform X3 [Zingiber officinale]
MGHGSSRVVTSGYDDAHHRPSRLSRFRRRFRSDRPSHGSDPPFLKNISANDFAGIARIEIICAEMQFKDRWMACFSLGERTYRTEISDHTEKPIWKSEKKVPLERDGPHVARISVFETNRLSRNNLVGYCEIDLFEVLSLESEDNIEILNLLDPSSANMIVGTISILCYVEDPIETEKSFAHRILSIVDLNSDGQLSYSEFAELINAFGNQTAASKTKDLFEQADKNGDGVVDLDELSTLLAVHQESEPLIGNCPVCGEDLGKFDNLNDMIHMSLCFDEGTGNHIMTGGFLTDKQASYGWLFKISEWAHVSSYDIGLRSGSSASHILVIDRRTKGLVEEIIDGKIVLSMRAIYQSKVGLTLINAGVKELLQSISDKQGKKMNSIESAEDIPKFIEFFSGQLNMDEAKYPIEHFKGRKFSIQGLLGKDVYYNEFVDGSLVIFRLAPQDYHRFHVPVSGTIESFHEIPGYLYTVNPIAVNSKYCNVFTENKRVVSVISTSEFGKVAFIAIGATMVGSITFTKEKGDYVHKGDEFGYFSFGGSTVICIFEKHTIEIDEDLLSNSERSLETLVAVGMRLGISKRSGRIEEPPKMETSKLEDDESGMEK